MDSLLNVPGVVSVANKNDVGGECRARKACDHLFARSVPDRHIGKVGGAKTTNMCSEQPWRALELAVAAS
jgi:hypothetical protein